MPEDLLKTPSSARHARKVTGGAMASYKQEVRQFAALPFHVGPSGDTSIYLVTARGSGRWIIPKGNPIRGLAPHKVAAREAYEEAGLLGRIGRDCIGSFEFDRRRDGAHTVCRVEVYALDVERQVRHWAEARQRTVRRCNLGTALQLLTTPDLSNLIEQFIAGRVAADPILSDELKQTL
jgi:8-oxo-dGTP pyrophosphatase MutT (NUDIX family)